MKNRILLLCALCALCVTLSARAESVTLKFTEITDLSAALASLDGQTKIVKYPAEAVPAKDDKPAVAAAPGEVVLVPYDLPGKTRLAIARDLAALQAALETFEAARKSILKQVGGGDAAKVQGNADLTAKFFTKWAEAVAEPIKVDLVKIPEADLKLDANPLPPTTLAKLLPVVK